MNMLYRDDEDIPVSIIDDYIREHKHHYVDNKLKTIMINLARKTLQ